MSNKLNFLDKLNALVAKAQAQGSQISIPEVQEYFKDMELSKEQMDLMFEYLMSQKIAVVGYVKLDSAEKEEIEFTEEEKAYLQEYMVDLKAFPEVSVEARKELSRKAILGDEFAKQKLMEAYLKEIVEVAKEMYSQDVFLGDLIQEGNLGLVFGVEMLTDAETAHETIMTQVRQSMQLLLEEQKELHGRDKKMIEKVQMLDEAIKSLTEEMGRKISIDELAIHLGMEIEEIEDILKLTGDEPEEEAEE